MKEKIKQCRICGGNLVPGSKLGLCSTCADKYAKPAARVILPGGAVLVRKAFKKLAPKAAPIIAGLIKRAK